HGRPIRRERGADLAKPNPATAGWRETALLVHGTQPMAPASALPSMNPASPAASDRRNARDASADRAFHWLVASAGIFVLVALGGAALSMLWGGREAFSTFGFGFLFSTEWDAVNQKFGALVP